MILCNFDSFNSKSPVSPITSASSSSVMKVIVLPPMMVILDSTLIIPNPVKHFVLDVLHIDIATGIVSFSCTSILNSVGLVKVSSTPNSVTRVEGLSVTENLSPSIRISPVSGSAPILCAALRSARGYRGCFAGAT